MSDFDFTRTLFESACLDCGQRRPMHEVLERVDAGEEDPACQACGGIQRSATIAFGQSLDRDVVESAIQAASDCDVFLAAGTSLQVNPAAGLCQVARRAGARLVVANGSPTPYDSVADAVLRDDLTTVLPALLT